MKIIRQKLILLSSIILAGNSILVYALYTSNKKLIDSEQLVRHTEQVITQANNVLNIAKDIENTSRGFIITNDSAFLKPLYDAKRTVFTFIHQLKQLTVDSPEQQLDIDSLTIYMNQRLRYAAKMAKIRGGQGPSSPIIYAYTMKGKHYTDHIRQIVSAIIQTEEGELAQRRQISGHETLIFNRFLVVIFILIGAFNIFFIIAIRKYLLQNNEKERRAGELVIANTELLIQNEKKVKQTEELNKVNQLYAFINRVNQDIVRVEDEATLFKNACHIALEFGKFKMAWIGMFDAVYKSINLVEQCGMPADVIELLFDAPIKINGPQDRVLQTGVYYSCNDVINEPGLENWQSFALKYSIRSCTLLPLRKAGKIIGTLNLYSAALNFSSPEEVDLLIEIAEDISFALDMIEKAAIQKQAEEQLAINERRFRVMIEKSTDMITLSTVDGEILYGSASIKNVLGYSTEELLKMSILDIIHPDDIPRAVEKKKKILLTPGKSFYYQQQRKHKNGTWIWCEGTLTNMLHEPGVHAMVSNFRDVSDKKLTEQQRDFDKNNLNALINNTNDLMWSLDRDFKLITSNKPFDNVVELISGKAIKKGDNALLNGYSAEQTQRFKERYERVFNGEAFNETEYTPFPAEFWSDISYSPIRKGGVVIGAACHSRNITESKIADRNLLLSESRLMEAQAISHVGNFEVDVKSQVEIWSDEMYKIYGIDKNKVTPSKELFLSFIHPDDLNYITADMNRLSKSKTSSKANFRFIHKDGSLRYGYSEAKFEFDKDQQPIRLFGILQDVTANKLADIERTKMVNDLMVRNNDLEQFAYIISHNLRAPVANIIGASSALNDADVSDEDKDILNKAINTSVMRLDDVVQDLNHILQVKSSVNETKEMVRFSELVEDIKVSIKNSIDKYNITIQYDFKQFNAFLTIKPYLYSIFYNLISNSIKYCRRDVPCVIQIRSEREKNVLRLIFADNGMGIDLKKRGDEVFGLYKRFHANTEGKGMGLYMVKTQVEILGGKISVTSEEDEGTEFVIAFEL